MRPINITIWVRSRCETLQRRRLRALLWPVCTKLHMSTSQQCVCVTERGAIIKHDLTDERVLLYLLQCCNGQLSLMITINCVVHVLTFLCLSLVGVWCVCVCVYLQWSALMWLTPSACTLQPDLVPSDSLYPPITDSTANIKQPIYFMTPALMNCGRFTVIFMY